jgi:glyoxylase-like metal-dependent hydrolase (beta-lactamase superfamily II)
MLKVKCFVFSPIQENTYILYNEYQQAIIIDPGCYDQNEKNQLSDFLHREGLKPKLLLNTHGHLDHVFGLKYVAETFGLIPHIHPKELPVLQFAPVSGKMYGLPFDPYEGEIKELNVGNPIQLGEDWLDLLFLPGHSPGSIGFYCAAQHFIIGGDVLFKNSIGRTDLPGGDLETLLKSIREKLLILPGETKVYSGHGPVTTIEEELKSNPFLNV